MGSIEDPIQTTIAILVATPLLSGCAVLSLKRQDVWSWLTTQAPDWQRKLSLGLMAVIPFACMLLIETPYNNLLLLGGVRYAWLEYLLCTALLALCFFAGQRHAVACIPAVAFFALIGFAQHFVRRFKNAAILPTDLLVLDTAAAVTNEYVFSLKAQTVVGISSLAIAVCLLSLVMPPSMHPTQTAHKVVINLGTALASAVALCALVLGPNYMRHLGVEMNYWYSIDRYQEQGFLPCFIAVAQDMPIRKPSDYTDEKAHDLEASYAASWRQTSAKSKRRTASAKQFDELKPCIVAIMNESFCDLSKYEGMHANYPGPAFFQTGFNDALAKGPLNVSVHGAGTCNTEFEFLTGNSMCFIGAGKYPYSIYDLANVDALPAQLSAVGYHSVAIHPNYPSNWKRDRVYPEMGFDEFISIEDFGGKPNCEVDKVTPNEPHCEVFHSGVSDAATYDFILERLESDTRPQFLFDVTMANHGSYDQNNLPDAYRFDYQPKDYVGEETPERLNEFLGCAAKSDDDLKEFIGKLRKLKRPVVLVFFGDHQPSISMSYNDYWYTDEPDDVHARRAFSTDYVVWANYDVAGTTRSGTADETSIDLLAAQTLDLIGAPLSEFQAAQLAIRQHIPSLSASGYQTIDRTWHNKTEAGPEESTYRDLSLIEYLNFAAKL